MYSQRISREEMLAIFLNKEQGMPDITIKVTVGGESFITSLSDVTNPEQVLRSILKDNTAVMDGLIERFDWAQRPRTSSGQPRLSHDSVVDKPSLLVDTNGELWWCDPLSKTITKATVDVPSGGTA